MSKYQQFYIDLAESKIWQYLEEKAGGECKDKTVYTSSNLASFKECPYAYHLETKGVTRESKNVMATRGLAVAKCIHRLHKEKKWNDSLDIWSECWDEAYNDPEEANVPWSKDTDKHEAVFSDGQAMIEGYVKLNRHAPVVATEVSFAMILENPRTETKYRFAGRIDQIRNLSAGVWQIVDTKCDQQAPSEAYLAMNTQFSAYGLALKTGTLMLDDGPLEIGDYPAEMIWYQLYNLVPYKKGGRAPSTGRTYVAGELRGDPSLPVFRSPDDYDRFRMDACRVIKAIRFGMFMRLESKISCSMCKHVRACTMGITPQGENFLDIANMEEM